MRSRKTTKCLPLLIIMLALVLVLSSCTITIDTNSSSQSKSQPTESTPQPEKKNTDVPQGIENNKADTKTDSSSGKDQGKTNTSDNKKTNTTDNKKTNTASSSKSSSSDAASKVKKIKSKIAGKGTWRYTESGKIFGAGGTFFGDFTFKTDGTLKLHWGIINGDWQGTEKGTYSFNDKGNMIIKITSDGTTNKGEYSVTLKSDGKIVLKQVSKNGFFKPYEKGKTITLKKK